MIKENQRKYLVVISEGLKQLKLFLLDTDNALFLSSPIMRTNSFPLKQKVVLGRVSSYLSLYTSCSIIATLSDTIYNEPTAGSILQWSE